MTAEIDVVIPVHNGAHMVTRAVESVFAQRGRWQLHIHLVDDGSTDDSPATLRALKDRFAGITLLSHPAPRGAAASRNRAVAESGSALIAFLDQDDEWMPNKLELQATLFEADPGLMYSVGLQQFILQPGHTRPGWCRPEWLVAPQTGFVPSTLLMRREAWHAVGPLDETIAGGADDLDWFSRARGKMVSFAAVPAVLANRYVHSANKSSDARDNVQGLLQAVRKRLASKEVQHRNED